MNLQFHANPKAELTIEEFKTHIFAKWSNYNKQGLNKICFE